MSDQMRVAVVTGGSRGIGAGIVAALARQGYLVVVNYRSDREAALATCARALELGAPRATAIQADVADLDSGRTLIESVLGSEGRVDLWVNNAGIAPRERRDLLEMTPESWDFVLATNLRGPFFLTQKVALAMERLRSSGTVPEPRIIFITSVSSTIASLNRGEYCVSKAGLSMVVQLFAARLAELGIPVYEIRPGIIDTEMTGAVHQMYDQRIKQGLVPTRRWGTPEDIGKAVASISSGSFPYSTGAIFHVDGGLSVRIL